MNLTTTNKEVLEFVKKNPNTTTMTVATRLRRPKRDEKTGPSDYSSWGMYQLSRLEKAGLVTRDRSQSEHRWSAVAQIDRSEETVLEFVRNNPGSSAREITYGTDAGNNNKVRAALKKLVTSGLLYRVEGTHSIENPMRWYPKGYNPMTDTKTINTDPLAVTANTQSTNPMADLPEGKVEMFKAVCLLQGTSGDEVIREATSAFVREVLATHTEEQLFEVLCKVKGTTSKEVIARVVNERIDFATSRLSQ